MIVAVERQGSRSLVVVVWWVSLYADVYRLSIANGGTQTLTVNAGKSHANRSYWILGSMTGTTPGVTLSGLHVPLNWDPYADISFAFVNTSVFTNLGGTLDANGVATASFNVPAKQAIPSGLTIYHAYAAFDASGKLYMASDAVPVRFE